MVLPRHAGHVKVEKGAEHPGHPVRDFNASTLVNREKRVQHRRQRIHYHPNGGTDPWETQQCHRPTLGRLKKVTLWESRCSKMSTLNILSQGYHSHPRRGHGRVSCGGMRDPIVLAGGKPTETDIHLGIPREPWPRIVLRDGFQRPSGTNRES